MRTRAKERDGERTIESGKDDHNAVNRLLIKRVVVEVNKPPVRRFSFCERVGVTMTANYNGIVDKVQPSKAAHRDWHATN